MRKLVICLAALFLGACKATAPAPAPIAADQTSPLWTHAAAADQAASRLVIIAEGPMPRQSDPEVSPLLDQVLDTSAVPPSINASDIGALNEWLLAAVKVNQMYVLSGTGMTDAQVPPTPAQSQRADANLSTYAPEIDRALDAQAILLGTEGAAVAQVGPNAGGDPSAYQQIQAQVAQAYASSLGVIGRPEMPDAWKEARAKVLASMAARVAPLLTPQDRQALQAAAREISAKNTDPALQAELADFATRIGPAA